MPIMNSPLDCNLDSRVRRRCFYSLETWCCYRFDMAVGPKWNLWGESDLKAWERQQGTWIPLLRVICMLWIVACSLLAEELRQSWWDPKNKWPSNRYPTGIPLKIWHGIHLWKSCNMSGILPLFIVISQRDTPLRSGRRYVSFLASKRGYFAQSEDDTVCQVKSDWKLY